MRGILHFIQLAPYFEVDHDQIAQCKVCPFAMVLYVI